MNCVSSQANLALINLSLPPQQSISLHLLGLVHPCPMGFYYVLLQNAVSAVSYCIVLIIVARLLADSFIAQSIKSGSWAGTSLRAIWVELLRRWSLVLGPAESCAILAMWRSRCAEINSLCSSNIRVLRPTLNLITTSRSTFTLHS